MYMAVSNSAGGGASAMSYLLSEEVTVDGVTYERDTEPEVLRGDPQQAVEIEQNIDNKWTYTVGSLNFAPEHSEKAKEHAEEIMDTFEDVAFPGMDEDQYEICWVLHDDKGKTELNFFIPRQELTTGKAYNPTPPGHQDRYDPWRDLINEYYGFADPTDPARARELQNADHELKLEALKERIDDDSEDIELDEMRGLIHENVKQGIDAGVIENRQDIIEWIEGQEPFEVTRQGEDYISVKLKDADGPAFQTTRKLKGRMYKDGWTVERENQRTQQPGEQRDSEPDEGKLEELREQIKGRIEQVAERNRERYSGGRERPEEPDFELEQLDGVGSLEVQSGRIARSIDDPLNPDNVELVELSDVVSGRESLRGRAGGMGGDESESTTDTDNRTGTTGADLEKGEREIESPGQSEGGTMNEQSRIGGLREYLDRFADSVREGVTQIGQSISGAIQKTKQRIGEFAESVREFTERRGLLNQLARSERGAVGMNQASENELDRFKTEINLAEFARDQRGAVQDETRSSRNSIVMKEAGATLVMTRGQDGHWQYFNVNDHEDSGSIIDYVQNRSDQNLGEVRQTLRPFVRGDGREPAEKSTREPIKDPETPETTRSEGVNRENPIPSPSPTAPETQAISRKFQSMSDDLTRSDYLTDDREISKDTLQDERFQSVIRTDDYETDHGVFTHTIYPHFNAEDELVGYERNDSGLDNPMFVEGGEKGVWRTPADDPDQVVVTESPEDAMAYHELNDMEDEDVQYVSFMGSPGDPEAKQHEAFNSIVERHDPDRITVAADQDEAGEKLTQAVADNHAEDRDVVDHRPDEEGQDWNDELQEQRELEREQTQSHGLSY
ncbi:MAG: toprim domain-containing protein [bacterium]